MFSYKNTIQAKKCIRKIESLSKKLTNAQFAVKFNTTSIIYASRIELLQSLPAFTMIWTLHVILGVIAGDAQRPVLLPPPGAILDWTTRFRLFLPNSTSGISLGRRSLDEDREKIYGIIEAMMYRSVLA